MGDQQDDRRKYQRYACAIDEGVHGRFTFSPERKELFTAYIFNISLGGMYFSVRNDQKNKFKKGDILTFVEIKKSGSQNYLINVESEIIWLLNHHFLNHIGLGCKFLKISENSKDQISKFIESCSLIKNKSVSPNHNNS